MPVAKGRVPGSHSERRVVFYGISTCVWCKRTRRFLESQGVAFDFFYLDLLSGHERDEVMAQVRRWNPRASFPTLVVDDSKCIVGYRQEEIKEVLGL